jgi:uncharacterized protein (TIGR00255 family)
MTGFGKASRSGSAYSVSAEVRSVNHRYVKISLKLPAALQAFDTRIEEVVKRRISRGSVTLTLRYESERVRTPFHVDPASVRGYVEALRQMKETYGLAGEPSLELVAEMPGVFQTDESVDLPPEEWTAIQETIAEALRQLVAMREAEGAQLVAEIRRRRRTIEKLVARIRKRAPRVVKEYHQKLNERAAALLRSSPLSVKEEDLRRDVAVFADRADVTEELARLDSHLKQFDDVIASGREVGRRLDFLLQEIFREVNTIASKASDAEIAHAVVEAKAEIEKIREQVQNLE